MRPRPHDLLRITSRNAVHGPDPMPDWAGPSLADRPWVVVRRAAVRRGQIPIGLRGEKRFQRHAAWLPTDAVAACVTPGEISRLVLWREHPRRAEVPALAALDDVAAILDGAQMDWGPGGSVGFELATGCPTATAESDLDIVIRAPTPVARVRAMRIAARLSALAVRIDASLETPFGAVALHEYAAGSPCAIKTAQGARLTEDPWLEPVASP